MADVIKNFNYSKTRGRGRGILGLTNFDPSRRPGERPASAVSSQQSESINSTTTQAEVAKSEQAESAGVYVR